MDEERNSILIEDENGHEMELDILFSFIHKEEEYAVLVDTRTVDALDFEDVNAELDLYVMRILTTDDMEEFVPVDDKKMPEITSLVQRYLPEIAMQEAR